MSTLDELRRTVVELHAELVRNDLVAWTAGNISDTIIYDGTDQPVNFGRTISMTPERIRLSI